MGDSLYATSRSFSGAATVSSSISKSSCKMKNNRLCHEFSFFLVFHIHMALIKISSHYFAAVLVIFWTNLNQYMWDHVPSCFSHSLLLTVFTHDIGQNYPATFVNVTNLFVLSRVQVTRKYMTCDRIDNISLTVIICKHDEKVIFKTACEIFFPLTVENMISLIISSTTVTNTEENRPLSGLYFEMNAYQHCAMLHLIVSFNLTVTLHQAGRWRDKSIKTKGVKERWWNGGGGGSMRVSGRGAGVCVMGVGWGKRSKNQNCSPWTTFWFWTRTQIWDGRLCASHYLALIIWLKLVLFTFLKRKKETHWIIYNFYNKWTAGTLGNFFATCKFLLKYKMILHYNLNGEICGICNSIR